MNARNSRVPDARPGGLALIVIKSAGFLSKGARPADAASLTKRCLSPVRGAGPINLAGTQLRSALTEVPVCHLPTASITRLYLCLSHGDLGGGFGEFRRSRPSTHHSGPKSFKALSTFISCAVEQGCSRTRWPLPIPRAASRWFDRGFPSTP